MHSIQLPVVRLNQEHQLYTYQTKIFEPKDQCNRPFAILSVYAPKSFRSCNSKCICNAIASFGKPFSSVYCNEDHSKNYIQTGQSYMYMQYMYLIAIGPVYMYTYAAILYALMLIFYQKLITVKKKICSALRHTYCIPLYIMLQP